MKQLILITGALLLSSLAHAEEVQGTLWDRLFNSPSNLRIIIDRTPYPDKPQRMTVYNGEQRLHTFPISTGREQFELPTSPLREPYCSFTPVGNAFTPQRLAKEHVSNLWEDAEMPYSVFFKGGVALHGVRTKDAEKNLGKPASGACIRLKEENAKIVFDLVEKNKTIINKKPDYSNVSIEVVDNRTPEELEKIEKECKDTREFWNKECKPELSEWRNNCKSIYEKEMAPYRHCMKLRRDDPKGKKPNTPENCSKSEELDGCLKSFIKHRNQCKSELGKWQQSRKNSLKINDTPAPATHIPAPPQRPQGLGTNEPLNILPPGQNTPPRPPKDIPQVRPQLANVPLPPARPAAPQGQSPKPKAQTGQKPVNDIWAPRD